MHSLLEFTNKVNGRRRRRPQIRDGVRQAVLQADTALLLVRQLGFSVADAARGTRASHGYVEAMAILHDFGDLELLAAVQAGEVPLLPTAERLKSLVRAMRAFSALSTADQTEFARRENPERLFNDVIVPASVPAPMNLVVEKDPSGGEVTAFQERWSSPSRLATGSEQKRRPAARSRKSPFSRSKVVNRRTNSNEGEADE
jgi:hypothetical protein